MQHSVIDVFKDEDKVSLPSTTLFGEDPTWIKTPLRTRFIEAPFSVLNANGGDWGKRKRAWKDLGIKSELGRDGFETFRKGFGSGPKYGNRKELASISIFDPVLCELMYLWFCPDGGAILDPFAGGSVRGIVANYLDYNYCGVELRKEQVEANYSNAAEIFTDGRKPPTWICGDSNAVLSSYKEPVFDFVFSCPPYADLEVYSDDPADISNKGYGGFLKLYRSIIRKSIALLKPGGYACFVVGEVRQKKGRGFYYGFVPDTIKAFEDAGAYFYNDVVLITSYGTTMLRTLQFSRTKKLVKTHQNVLIFQKPQEK